MISGGRGIGSGLPWVSLGCILASMPLGAEIFKLVVASVKLFRLLFYSNGLAPVAG
jgi:hypothetical protein